MEIEISCTECANKEKQKLGDVVLLIMVQCKLPAGGPEPGVSYHMRTDVVSGSHQPAALTEQALITVATSLRAMAVKALFDSKNQN